MGAKFSELLIQLSVSRDSILKSFQYAYLIIKKHLLLLLLTLEIVMLLKMSIEADIFQSKTLNLNKNN